jgi:hypothetical protein
LSDVVQFLIVDVIVLGHLFFEFLVTLLLEGTRVNIVLTSLVVFNLLLLDGVLDFVDLVLLLLDLVVHCILSFLAFLLSSSHSVLQHLVLVFHLLLEGSFHLTHLVVKLGQ